MDDRVWLKPPPMLRATYADLDWKLAYQYAGHSVVYRLERGGVPESFVKLAHTGHFPTLDGEAKRMRWAQSCLPVPTVVHQGTGDSIDWLVTTALPGRDATNPDLTKDPAELTRILARGLRMFHDTAPARTCPFDFRIRPAIRHVRARLRSGRIDPQGDFHEEFAHLTPTAAVELLESIQPESEDLVVCHGDYCLPNILIEDGRATGFVDLGELGVADRWWDLAAATWSLTWNLGPDFEELFLAEYGATLDSDRARFYRLLYDLAS
jgi:kanamycin kinase